jgi:hypothetical protein
VSVIEPQKRFRWGRVWLGIAIIGVAASGANSARAGTPPHPITAEEVGALLMTGTMKVVGLYLILSAIWPRFQFRRKKRDLK